MSSRERPRIGISACLLGDEVRYDGGHKRDPFLTDVLGPHVEWVRVCPEVEVGMGTPRETLQLVRDRPGTIRMVTTHTAIDYTDAMGQWASRRLDQLASMALSGYVLKKDSPSCGLHGVTVYGPGGVLHRDGRGLFAEALLGRFPHLPVEDEGRLAEADVRESFVERVFASARLRRFFGRQWTVDDLSAFHAAHEMSLLAHSGEAYGELARLLSNANVERAWLQREYESGFMRALEVRATPQRHANVLCRLTEHLADVLDRSSADELTASIHAFARGLVPRSAPLLLIREQARVRGIAPLLRQTYLDPHPAELLAVPGL